MDNLDPPNDTITFLGTGAGRFMITSQRLASGGLWMNLGGTQLLVDPGPGCIVRATDKKLDAQKLSAIILSHRHLDHSADTNIMIEAMTRGGHNQHGMLFAPSDALGKEPVIYTFLKNYLDEVVVLEEGGTYTVDNVSFSTPIRHIHGPETYGIIFRTVSHTFSNIADTRFFKELPSYYEGELLIINVVFVEPRPETGNPLLPTAHLAIPDAEEIIRIIRPKMAIITHFGHQMWEIDPHKTAQKMTERTGTRVIAASDGMQFSLSELDD
ncbi:MAG: MBL fold hydrolase [Chloroflexi bacterium RBG_13_46_14]|nr:MAG: MBL fold hydrolase [Chloroflexi bacterium RBG_13_46_14]